MLLDPLFGMEFIISIVVVGLDNLAIRFRNMHDWSFVLGETGSL